MLAFDFVFIILIYIDKLYICVRCVFLSLSNAYIVFFIKKSWINKKVVLQYIVIIYPSVREVSFMLVFDRDYYLAQNPDVAAAGVDPEVHFKTVGYLEGRNPSENVDVAYYLLNQPNAIMVELSLPEANSENSLVVAANIGSVFDTSSYLMPSSAAIVPADDIFAHYIAFGQKRDVVRDKLVVLDVPHVESEVENINFSDEADDKENAVIDRNQYKDIDDEQPMSLDAMMEQVRALTKGKQLSAHNYSEFRSDNITIVDDVATSNDVRNGGANFDDCILDAIDSNQSIEIIEGVEDFENIRMVDNLQIAEHIPDIADKTELTDDEVNRSEDKSERIAFALASVAVALPFCDVSLNSSEDVFDVSLSEVFDIHEVNEVHMTDSSVGLEVVSEAINVEDVGKRQEEFAFVQGNIYHCLTGSAHAESIAFDDSVRAAKSGEVIFTDASALNIVNTFYMKTSADDEEALKFASRVMSPQFDMLKALENKHWTALKKATVQKDDVIARSDMVAANRMAGTHIEELESVSIANYGMTTKKSMFAKSKQVVSDNNIAKLDTRGSEIVGIFDEHLWAQIHAASLDELGQGLHGDETENNIKQSLSYRHLPFVMDVETASLVVEEDLMLPHWMCGDALQEQRRIYAHH